MPETTNTTRRTLLKGAGVAALSTTVAGCALLDGGQATEEEVEGIPDEPFRLTHMTFESGPAAFYGEQAVNALELLVDDINAEGGLLGEREIDVVETIDEGAGADTLVSDTQRLGQQDETDLLFGVISSANLLAVAPTADEQQLPFIATIAGTYQLFEENPEMEYVARTCATNSAGAVSAARVVAEMEDVETVVTIDQDYAWGHDHRDMVIAVLEGLRPDIDIVESRTPEPFISDYSAHVSAIQDRGPDVLMSSLWGGDIATFMNQAVDEGLFDDVGTGVLMGDTGSPLLQSLGGDVPENVLLGGRGGYQFNFRAEENPLQREFAEAYLDAYGEYPGWGAYHTWQGVRALEVGVERVVDITGNWPTDSQLISAISNVSFNSPGGMHTITDYQAVAPGVYGRPVTSESAQEYELTDYQVVSPVDCNPPQGVPTMEYVETITE
ncbi:ABC transporter substrate-binding protein [Natronobeatus ordinarius]|uniref:ABC transporter substrate-binding protein n=1 Tax=Natronobeatus ordinarius TaxID=2963433 RepID=UPI0020CF92FC|nr:ABC transporter substrate-binding protein [Natronobeatus ordinarius]